VKYLLIALGILGALVLCVVLVGALLPKQHRATRAARFDQPPDEIWAALTNYREFPSWRSNVKRVEAIENNHGLPAWREFDSHGQSLPMQMLAFDPPHRCVVVIADPNLPFGGTWTTEIIPAAGGSIVRITEDGEVRNVLFRFMSRFVFGYTSTMDTYLRDLGRKFGESVHVAN
jgi:uncharacterized protein YndB with AHSA1/START domain